MCSRQIQYACGDGIRLDQFIWFRILCAAAHQITDSSLSLSRQCFRYIVFLVQKGHMPHAGGLVGLESTVLDHDRAHALSFTSLLNSLLLFLLLILSSWTRPIVKTLALGAIFLSILHSEI